MSSDREVSSAQGATTAGSEQQDAAFGTVRRDGDGWTITFVRELANAPAAVWDALTEPQRLARWLATTEVDPQVGGRIRHDFGDDEVTGTISQWTPPRLLEYGWRFSDGTDSVLRIELEPSGSGTQLTLVHRGLGHDQAVGYGAGWHAYLDRLATLLAGQDPPAWALRFTAVLPAYRDAAG